VGAADPHASTRMRYWLVGLGIALAVAGGAFYAVAASNVSALSTQFLADCLFPTFPLPPNCVDILGQLNYWGTIRSLSIVVIVLGIIVVVLGIVLEAMRTGQPVVPVPPPGYAAPMHACPRCGAAIAPGWTHCGRCGARV